MKTEFFVTLLSSYLILFLVLYWKLTQLFNSVILLLLNQFSSLEMPIIKLLLITAKGFMLFLLTILFNISVV